ncbi:ATP-dependent DNA helicase DDX11 [Lutzomyia longipalpis]|uniref:ATP-dependent DNA helicase DDX11 n=1 Tax=Lutzomyia longipalpis TaxID=7200 RepID=UPI0024840370|nr:ATP-dependent DNA helicase DDX11 [Lutzomyia longipalpis]
MTDSVGDFGFPFPPYKIQEDFMKSLYEVIEERLIGIFESPTGTGKTLSLLCGALTWLHNNEEQLKRDLRTKVNDVQLTIEQEEKKPSSGGDWIESQYATIKLKEDLMLQKKMLDLILEHDKKIQAMRERKRKEVHEKRKWRSLVKKEPHRVESDGEDHPEEIPDGTEDFLLEEIYADKEPSEEEPPTDEHKCTKIFFCSRTHSQLAQVLEEIRKTKFAKNTRIVSLASRQNFCVNDEVRGLKSAALINEKCLDLQRNRSKVTSIEGGKALKKKRGRGCEFLRENTIENLRDSILSDITDIEEIIQMGQGEKSCPYYASRAAISDAQLVLLPYQMIFHGRTRDQMGINLKDSVIIVDEAHNLLDTISSIYCAEIDLEQLKEAQNQLTAYRERYVKKFSTKNLLKLNQLIFVVGRLVKMFPEVSKDTHRIILSHQLMSEGEFFNINLYELLNFCENTRLAQKVQGFSMNFGGKKLKDDQKEKTATQILLEKLESDGNKKKRGKKVEINQAAEQEESEAERKNTPSVIRPVLAFLERLTEDISDGRILLTWEPKPRMKYLLLKPDAHFSRILSECRALVVAGGTMQPTNELKEHIFSREIPRIREYIFDHVVPENSVLPLIVPRGPAGKALRLDFASRSSKESLMAIGMALQNLCNVVPAGIVVFLSSYDYLNAVFQHLDECGVLGRIRARKKVFREPRQGGRIEGILSEYSDAATKGGGAIMFSVVGGKLSEGLNFSDDLGRCVVVVGLPFPNKTNPELIEKMKHCDTILRPGAGNDYYENLCMKAVNQCIGRAVRHINDYASVILLDERYAQERISRKLPGWIRRSLKEAPNFGAVQSVLVKFFREKRTGI